MKVFAHGVASGDPAPDGAILWTRVTLPPASGAVPVQWRVTTDAGLNSVAANGEVVAEPENDHTIRVTVDGLDPGTTYYYGFECQGAASPVGRTRTAPGPPTERLRLGVVSCASWTHGFFNVYRRLAERNLDLVVHVGDYIYETGNAKKGVRRHRPGGTVRTLTGYRTRHAQYKTDRDLQELHRRHPVTAVWDDHDVAGDAWRDGAGDHDPDDDGDWSARKAAAVQAYLEWVPVRLPDVNRPDRIYRTIHLGDLADLMVLDTRLAGRDRPAAAGQGPVATIDKRDRSILGKEQRDWLHHELTHSRARWRLVGNQVMMAPLRAIALPRGVRRMVPGRVAGGAGFNGGQWDGYPEERSELFRFLRDERIDNFIVLTGDLHSSWAGELTTDPDSTHVPVGVEFVTPSVTSQSFADMLAPPLPGGRALLRRLIGRENPHWRFFDLEAHGYVLLDITPERVRAEFWHVATVGQPAAGERLAAAFDVACGEPRLVRSG